MSAEFDVVVPGELQIYFTQMKVVGIYNFPQLFICIKQFSYTNGII